MCLDQRLMSLRFIVSVEESVRSNVSLFFLCSIKLRMTLMLWEVSVIKVCEMLLEFSREKKAAGQNLCTHWLSSGSMLSKPPFDLKLFRRSHISAIIFFTDASFQVGEKDHIIKELHLFYYAKPSRRSFLSIYITYKEEMCFRFFQVGLWKWPPDLKKD